MTRPFSTIVKPIGPRCNIDCACCCHLGRERPYPGFRLGSVMPEGLAEMAASPGQAAFGATKSAALPARCRACRFRLACNGGCPGHRFARTTDGEGGRNHFRARCRQVPHHAGPPLPAPAAAGNGEAHQGQRR